MSHNKRRFAGLSAILLLSLVLAACSGAANAATGSSSNNFTGYGSVTQTSYTDTVESTGQIQPQHISSLNFTTTGRVAQSNVSVGQAVKTGDVLMSLDPASVPANLSTAQTDLANAQDALTRLTNPDLATISTSQKALSAAYTSFQQAQDALSNAILNNQSASNPDNYTSWLSSKQALDSAQNNLPLANASIDVQAYYQAVRDTADLKAQLAAAQQNASNHPSDAILAQKVTDLQKAVSDSETNANTLKIGLDASAVSLADQLSASMEAYNTSASAFIGQVITNTASSNLNTAQVQADLTQKQSDLIKEQTSLANLQNTRLNMNGLRCSDATIKNYLDAFNVAQARWDHSAHIIGSKEYQALQTAEANYTWCNSVYTASEIAQADANVAAAQAQIQLIQAQISSDQSQLGDGGSSVYGLAISLNNAWAAYQDATQQLNSAVTSLYQVERAPSATDLAAAQAKVRSAQAEVNSMTLTAPYDAVVTSVGYQVGDTVSQSTPAVVLVDRSKYYVDLSVDESHVVKLAQGDAATITLEASPGQSLTGTVSYINPVGTSNQGVVYYDVTVTLDQADPTLLIGATADVTMQAGQTQTVLTVPVSAVGSDSQGEFVYVIDSNGNAQQVSVVSGQILADNTVIVTGNLQAGQKVGLLQTTSTNNNGGGPGGGGRFFVP